MRSVALVMGFGLLGLACGRDWDSFHVVDRDAGGGGGGATGDSGVGGGTCFPGAKVCPDPKTGELVCLGSNVPANGCKASTACDPCVLPHATATCSDQGKCSVDACNAGYADCNGDPSDGCETNLNADKLHCGDCSTDCTQQNGPGWICTGGVCAVNECCPDGQPACLNKLDCDEDKSNGCEVDLGVDPQNCGGCGILCSLSHVIEGGCAGSSCTVITCEAGWDDCDDNDLNGCETHIDGDSANCGACAKGCSSANGAAACSGGTCQIACNTGSADCNNDPGTDGCEISITQDPKNCGGCGKPCSNPNTTGPTCANGSCGYSGCVGQFRDCNGLLPDGCEIDIDSDVNNCGSCGTPCPQPGNSTATCTTGVCGLTCNGGFTKCGSVCLQTTTDSDNCGSCGHHCGPGSICTGGACGGCAAGLLYCNDQNGCKPCCTPLAPCSGGMKCCMNYTCAC